MRASAVLAVTAAMLLPAQALAQVRAPTVEFRNDLPSQYRLDRVRLWVDGKLAYDGRAPFDATLPPGEHLVTIGAGFRLDDPVFRYVRGYRVELTASRYVHAPSSGPVVARARERGGVTVPLDRRAVIAWRSR